MNEGILEKEVRKGKEVGKERTGDFHKNGQGLATVLDIEYIKLKKIESCCLAD